MIHLKTELLAYMKQFGHMNHEMLLSDKVVFVTYGQLRSLGFHKTKKHILVCLNLNLSYLKLVFNAFK